jgi:hypothetical protein
MPSTGNQHQSATIGNQQQKFRFMQQPNERVKKMTSK